MAQYQVPQFIEVEDKIFGPLTLKQFIYLAGGGGLCLLLFSFLPLYLTVLLGIPVLALSAGLAFFEINGRPLIHAMEHAFSYFFGSKLYLWQQRQAKATPQVAPGEAKQATVIVPKLSESKLRDLSWSLNIKDRTQMGVTSQAPSGFEI
jgi:hypothetical protein